MNRGRREEAIFLRPWDYEAFLLVVRETVEVWNLKVAAYCLMTNHYHLLVQTPEGNISRCMRNINGVYTQRFNRRYKKDGQLFRGRYKAVLVAGDSHLLEVMRYIHRNPLRAGIVEHLSDYLWSSHHGYMSAAKKWEWLYKEFLLAMLSPAKSQRRKVYIDFVSRGEPEEIERFYSIKKLPSLLGGVAFKKWVKEEFHKLRSVKEIPESRELAPTPEEVISQVCSYFQIKEGELKKLRRGKENLPRDIAIYLCRYCSRKSLVEIGNYFAIGNYSTVSNAVQRIRARRHNDRTLRKIIVDLTSQIYKSQRQT